MHIRTATTAQSPEELLNDLRSLVSHAELMLNPPPAAHIPAFSDSPHPDVDADKSSLSGLYTGTKTRISAALGYTDGTIRAHPYPSLALALGAGVLAGVLMGRRSR